MDKCWDCRHPAVGVCERQHRPGVLIRGIRNGHVRGMAIPGVYRGRRKRRETRAWYRERLADRCPHDNKPLWSDADGQWCQRCGYQPGKAA